MPPLILLIRIVYAAACALLPVLAQAAMGLVEMDGAIGAGPVTIFYPSTSEARPVERGPFLLDVALNGDPVRGNGRLIVISHGSPSSPWVHSDLARTLVEAGFIVAMPEHRADNYKDDSDSGPESWKRRPVEMSRAIDLLERDAYFGRLLRLDKVGMFGMSAGGHTGLTLAGGRWSPAQLKQHCDAYIGEDFHTCAGLGARLTGGLLDGLKKQIVLSVAGGKLADTSWYAHTDPRIAAIVVGVPFAVDFDAASLAVSRVPLGIITAGADKWLVPKFHSERVLQGCPGCERIADIKGGGHGALLSPLPPGRSGLLADLIGDPPEFDREQVIPEVNRKIAAFFLKHLISQGLAKHPDASSSR